jgi:hypothetical protein
VELDDIRVRHSPLNADFSQYLASILEIAGHIRDPLEGNLHFQTGALLLVGSTFKNPCVLLNISRNA